MAARRGLDFWAGMALGVALLAGWLTMLAFNAMPYLQGGATPPAPLALLARLVTPPGLELAPGQAALVGWALAALVVGLAVALIAGALRVGRRHHPAFGPAPLARGDPVPLTGEGPSGEAFAGQEGALAKEAGGEEHPPLPVPVTPESARAPAFPAPAAAPAAGPLVAPPEAIATSEAPPAAPAITAPVAPGMPAQEPPAPMAAPVTRAATAATFEPWVFISHSSADEAFGQRLAASLRAALAPDEAGRARVWYDQAPERGQEDAAESGGVLEPGGLTVGMDYPTEIAEQIAARTVIVVVLSPEAARSRWVKYELSQSVRRYNGSERVLICPLIYRACVTPNSIGIFQTLDFQGADSDEARYQQQVGELVARLSDGRWPLSESAPPFEVAALPAPERLVGRDEHLEWVVSRLRAGGATAITALGGLGGIGKSALAAVAIRQLRAEGAFPDGIVVVGCEQETDAAKILRAAIERFLPGQRTLDAATLPVLASAALKELEGKRALIVLDNVEPGLAVADVCGPLKEAGVTLLLTARQTPPDAVVPAYGVRRLELLDAAHALAVFTQTYRGPDADPAALSAEERAAAERIVIAVDRHTLAVRLAGSQAAGRVAGVPLAQRGAVLAAVAAGIEHDMLGIPNGDTSRKVEMVLRLSVDALPLDGLRLFTALAAFATSEFGRQAASALARGLALANPEDAVDLLIRRALLDPSYDAPLAAHAHADAERLRLHPLLRALATKLLAAWPEAERDAAQRAIAEWYGDYMPQVNNSSPVGYLALTPDEANIIGALDWALVYRLDFASVDICDVMKDFWRATGRTQAGLSYLPLGTEAAGRIADQTQKQEDRLRQADIAASYGDMLKYTGKLSEAEAIFQQDINVRRACGDKLGEAMDLSRLGEIADMRGRIEEAERYVTESLAMIREMGSHFGEGVILSNLGHIAQHRGQLEEAERYFTDSLVINREVGDLRGEGIDIANLGQIALQRRRLEEATAYFEKGLTVLRKVGDRQNEGASLSNLGQIAWYRGQLEEAERYFTASLAIDREMGDRRGEGVNLSSLGLIAQHRGRLAEAEACHRQSLAIRREVGDQEGEGKVLFSLARLAERRGDLSQAEARYWEGLAIMLETQDGPHSAMALQRLGAFLLRHGRNQDEGRRKLDEAIALWQAMGLSDQEEQAREKARAVGYDPR